MPGWAGDGGIGAGVTAPEVKVDRIEVGGLRERVPIVDDQAPAAEGDQALVAELLQHAVDVDRRDLPRASARSVRVRRKSQARP